MAKKKTSAVASEDPRKRWWQMSGDELGREVWSIATGLEEDQKSRIEKVCKSLAMYEGLDVTNLNASAYMTGRSPLDEDDEEAVNISRTGCNAVVAEIAGRQKPSVKVLTYGGDWQRKRQARRLEKWIEGNFRARHGRYLNIWQLKEEVFLDSTIMEAGVEKYIGVPAVKNKKGKVIQPARIVVERAMTTEFFVDPVDARYGNPNSLFAIYPMDRDAALWKFADNPSLELSDEDRTTIRSAILVADEYEQPGEKASSTAKRASESIKVVEAWRRRLPSGEPGLHVFAVNNACLASEEWTEDGFPIVRQLWAKHRWGWGGTSLLEEGRVLAEGLSEQFAKMRDRFRVTGGKRTYIEEGSVVKGTMEENGPEQIIEIRKGSQMPVEGVPAPINQAEIEWMQLHREWWWLFTRMSEMRASARKEPGIEAGVAIQLLGDMQSATFSITAKNYENSYVESAHQFVLRARALAEAGEDPSAYCDEEIAWSEVDMPENTFCITAGPVSALPNDAPGRIQLASTLADRGLISPEVYARMLQLPDLETELNQLSAQTRYIERVIDTILDAQTKRDAQRVYKAPDSLLYNKPAALLQVGQAYFDAMVNEAPVFCLAELRRYMEELQEQIMVATAAQQAKLAAEAAAQQGITPSPDQAPPAAA